MPREQREKQLRADFETSALVTVRMCLIALVLLTSSFFSFYFRRSLPQIEELWSAPAICLFLFLGLSVLWCRVKSVRRWAVALQCLLDIALITVATHYTGDSVSPLIVLYLPVVMAAVILASRAFGFAVAAAALLSYALLLAAASSGIVQALGGAGKPEGGLLLQMIGLGSAMVLVTFATDYLRRTLQAGKLLMEQSKQDLLELSVTQKILIDGIPDSVIITTLDGGVASINQTALDLFKTTKEHALGIKLSALLAQLFPGGKIPDFEQGQHEIEATSDGGAVMRLVYTCQPIADESGKRSGTLYIFQDVTKLRSAEEQLALQERMAKLLAEKKAVPSGLAHPKLSGFVGESPIMRKVFQLIQKVAPSDANVLITGESGTGKELVARAIHLCGGRSSGPFVALNCGAVPENLIESELFGHKKGSFTGADSDHPGMFQQAHGGTLFLDEIGELPLHMQAKLLRAIQEKRVRMVGADREIPTDVRIVSATNKNLRKEVGNGDFREDLYYRLNVVAISLPPLRERKEDIPLLVNTILKTLVREDSTPVVAPAVMQCLLRYDYPGNVRELENILERALVLSGEVIVPDHLPENVRGNDHPSKQGVKETEILVDEALELPVNLDQILADIEKRYLEVALLKTNGAKKKAANLLGINFRSFRYRLQKFGFGE